MNIQYKNNTVKKQCTDRKKAKKDFGEYADDVLGKINLIEEMTSFKDLLSLSSLRCHSLSGKSKNYWAIDVKGKKCSLRIILAPLDENGNIIQPDADFPNKCTSLNIILIEEVSNHYE